MEVIKIFFFSVIIIVIAFFLFIRFLFGLILFLMKIIISLYKESVYLLIKDRHRKDEEVFKKNYEECWVSINEHQDSLLDLERMVQFLPDFLLPQNYLLKIELLKKDIRRLYKVIRTFRNN